MCPESAKIVWRKRKRHPDMVPIPCPGQVQMFTPHTEYLGMGGPGISAKNEKNAPKIRKNCPEKRKRHQSMMYIPCPSQVKLSPPHIVNLGIVCPRISAKNGKMCPESQTIPTRHSTELPDMVPIPCPGQVQMFTPHTEYLGMGGPGISAKNEKMHHKSAKIAQRKGRDIQA